MAELEDHATALEEPSRPRKSGLRIAEIRELLLRSFGRPRDDSQRSAGEPYYEPWQDDMPRFAVVRNGYHCSSVDQYVGELEQELAELDRELAELRAARVPEPSSGEVAAEIKRVGEQTSTVLIAAHEQAQETVRAAQAEAEGRIAGAQAEAEAILARANQSLRELEAETKSVQRERERLLEEVRSAATALTDLVGVSFGRFPPLSDNSGVPA